MYVRIKVEELQLKNSLYYPDEDEVALNEQAGGSAPLIISMNFLKTLRWLVWLKPPVYF